MPLHRIRLKAPWLVSAQEKGQPLELPPELRSAKMDLPELLRQLLGNRSVPVEVQAVRRFHRPTGLSDSSRISVAITSQLPPDRLLFGPIDPGEESSNQLRELESALASDNRIEFVLPQNLQLRSELRLQWDQLSPESSVESLLVELLIREPDDE